MKSCRILLLAVVGMIPACGGDLIGTFLGGPPAATVVTPTGSRHSIVAIDYALFDVERNPITITVEYSTNGGTTFAPATPAYANGSLSGLASSAAGTAHTFLWNSVEDGVATGAAPVNNQVQIRITPSDGNVGTPATTGDFTVDNTVQRVIGVATAIFPHSFAALGNSETALGDLVSDAFRVRYGVQLAMQNGWGIRTPLPSAFMPADLTLRRPAGGYAAGPPYDLVWGDVAQMLPFGDRVVTRTVTGTQLWAILEYGVSFYPSNFNGFPQVSGFSFSFKASNPAGSRLLTVTLDGGAPIASDATTYTFATNNYINAGGDGYTMLNDGQGTAQELDVQVVADHIESLGTITPTIAGRMTVVP